MIGLSYIDEGGQAIMEVYKDKSDLSSRLCISTKTLNRWFDGGRFSLGKYDIRGVGICSDVYISNDVYVYRSNRGCPRGDNRFKNNV